MDDAVRVRSLTLPARTLTPHLDQGVGDASRNDRIPRRNSIPIGALAEFLVCLGPPGRVISAQESQRLAGRFGRIFRLESCSDRHLAVPKPSLAGGRVLG